MIWGVLQMAVAVAAQGIDSALQDGLAALSYASGPIVGAFLLGVLHPRRELRGDDDGDDHGAGGQSLGRPPGAGGPPPPGVAWTWNVAIGAIVTVVVGLVVSRLFAGENERAPLSPDSDGAAH